MNYPRRRKQKLIPIYKNKEHSIYSLSNRRSVSRMAYNSETHTILALNLIKLPKLEKYYIQVLYIMFYFYTICCALSLNFTLRHVFVDLSNSNLFKDSKSSSFNSYCYSSASSASHSTFVLSLTSLLIDNSREGCTFVSSVPLYSVNHY